MACAKKGLTPFFLSLLWVWAILSVPSDGFAADQIYKYTDDAGTVNYTSDWYSIPEQYRSRVETMEPQASQSLHPGSQNPDAAAVRVVTASGEYRMGDHDTRADAVRLATEAAKRNALEQVATYLESVTVVSDLDITRDEIKTYTAGVVLVMKQETSTRLEGQTVVIHVDLTAQVDPTEVAQAIAALRENESAKSELVALQTEVSELHQQLEAANQALATATSSDEVQALTQQRQQLLNQLQANALVSQAWTDWVFVTPVASPYPWIGIQQVQGLLLQARHLNPTNPHLKIMQQAVTIQAGPSPPGPLVRVPSQPPHPSSLLVPAPIVQQPLPPHLSQPPSSSPLPPGGHQVVPVHPPQSLSPTPLPPTLHQVHPPHVAQSNPPVLRAPFWVPPPTPRVSQPRGGGGGRRGR